MDLSSRTLARPMDSAIIANFNLRSYQIQHTRNPDLFKTAISAATVAYLDMCEWWVAGREVHQTLPRIAKALGSDQTRAMKHVEVVRINCLYEWAGFRSIEPEVVPRGASDDFEDNLR